MISLFNSQFKDIQIAVKLGLTIIQSIFSYTKYQDNKSWMVHEVRNRKQTQYNLILPQPQSDIGFNAGSPVWNLSEFGTQWTLWFHLVNYCFYKSCSALKSSCSCVFINSELAPLCHLSQRPLLFVTLDAIIVHIYIVILYITHMSIFVHYYTCLYYLHDKIVHQHK